jgi:hypothetical protein
MLHRPTLNAVVRPTETDTVVFDVFTATSGTFLAEKRIRKWIGSKDRLTTRQPCGIERHRHVGQHPCRPSNSVIGGPKACAPSRSHGLLNAPCASSSATVLADPLV